MLSRAQYAEYLAEIREQVCDHCPQRVPGQPPFRPPCWQCGVELQFPQLVKSICEAGDALSELDPCPERQTVCAQCVCLGRCESPCPVGLLAARLVRAVRSVEERRQQRELLHRRLVQHCRARRAYMAGLIQAYELTTGTCVGCD
jgi:hypothetical protein